MAPPPYYQSYTYRERHMRQPIRNPNGAGPPLGSSNATKHGIFAFLAVGRLPKGTTDIRRQLDDLEDSLRECVMAKRGEITLHHAALVQSACRHEGRALLLARWLRERVDQMTDHDRLSYLREIGNASDARDRALKALGLDNAARDVLDALYAPAAPPPANTDDKGPSLAPNGGSGPGTGKHPTPGDGPLNGQPCPDCGGQRYLRPGVKCFGCEGTGYAQQEEDPWS